MSIYIGNDLEDRLEALEALETEKNQQNNATWKIG